MYWRRKQEAAEFRYKIGTRRPTHNRHVQLAQSTREVALVLLDLDTRDLHQLLVALRRGMALTSMEICVFDVDGLTTALVLASRTLPN